MTAIEFNTRILQEKSSLNNFALSLTRNTEDALDLIQDTYLKAITYREKFQDSTNLKAWLFTIMKNTFINAYRKNTKTKKLISKGDDVAMNRAFKQNTHNQTESRMNTKEIVKQIESLEDHYKVPFTRYYSGYKYEEIAHEMQLPLGTIKSRIFIARKMLMDNLQHLKTNKISFSMSKNSSKQKVTLFWFRRDLRLKDNHGLFQALKHNSEVLPIFIFDTDILNKLEDKYDRRLDFIHQALTNIQLELNALESGIKCYLGKPLDIFKTLSSSYQINSVYCNHDYEPYAIERDTKIKHYLEQNGISFFSFKDQCIFEKNEITKDDGMPYTVFTPYSKKWKAKLNADNYIGFNAKEYFKKLFASFKRTNY